MQDESPIEAPEQFEPSPLDVLGMFMQAENVADLLSEEALTSVANEVKTGYKIDKDSQKDWRQLMDRGIELATLTKKDKTYPFKNASNVKYPLVTTAALQFNARAYPAIVPPAEPVKCRVHGRDPNGAKAARCERVSEHMSFQLMSQMEEWEESTDKLTTVLPIVGMAFRKWWFDPAYGRARVRLVEPGALVVNNSVRSLAEAPRISEEMPLFPSEIMTRRRSGQFRNIDYVENTSEDTQEVQDFIEQHCRMDLDGDGYDEPYIVTMHKDSEKIARIVADFGPEDVIGPRTQEGILQGIVKIERGSYYVDFQFLPSLDGGFMGTGLGLLLGDISNTVNSIINLLLDAGHMASRGGGFIGREFRLKGGSQQFRPGEWRQANATGGDIRNSIVPLTFPSPDPTLFSLLGLMVDAGKEVAATKDVITGDTGNQQMTAAATIALIEQGLAQFTAAYKRIFRSLKREYKILAKINARHLSPQEYAQFHDDPQQPANPQQDYSLANMDIEPVADPTAVTKMQEAAKAQMVMQMAEMGLVDRLAAAQRVIEASNIGDVEELMPKPDPMQQAMQQMQMQAAQVEMQLKIMEIDEKLAEIEETRSKTLKNVSDAAAKERELSLNEARARLEELREGLKLGLETVLGRSSGMAGAPDVSALAGGAQGPAGSGAGINPGSLLAGQPPAGIGAPGIPSGGRFV